MPEFDHLAFIKDTLGWPCWPVLPVKNTQDRESNGFPKTGVLLDPVILGLNQDVPQAVVYDHNLFLKLDTANLPPVLVQYESLDALLAAGWVVD
jgi:hypothetical protein